MSDDIGQATIRLQLTEWDAKALHSVVVNEEDLVEVRRQLEDQLIPSEPPLCPVCGGEGHGRIAHYQGSEVRQ